MKSKSTKNKEKNMELSVTDSAYEVLLNFWTAQLAVNRVTADKYKAQ